MPSLVEELVELLVVDPMGSLDLAIQVWGPRPDVDVADVTLFEMPVKVGLEFGAIVGLHDVDAEGQAAEDVVDECDRRALIAGVEDFQHANAGAIVDGGELVEPPARARQCARETSHRAAADVPAAPSRSASSGARAAGTSDWPVAGSCRAGAECDARRHKPPTGRETASDNRQSCLGRSDSAAGGRESCSRPLPAWPAASGAAPGPGPPIRYRRARDTAVATCRTSSGKCRNAGRCARHCRHSWPPGASSGANGSTAVARSSSSDLQSKVFRLRRRAGCHLCPVISQIHSGNRRIGHPVPVRHRPAQSVNFRVVRANAWQVARRPGPENGSSKLTAHQAYVVRDLIQGDLLNSAFNCDASVWQWVLQQGPSTLGGVFSVHRARQHRDLSGLTHSCREVLVVWARRIEDWPCSLRCSSSTTQRQKRG